MSENKKEIQNSSFSLTENKINSLLPGMFDLNKTKKKCYFVYKNGTKYIVKQKEKGKKNLKEIKNDKSASTTAQNLEKQIYNKFYSKYEKMPNNYNSYVINKIMHNINSHIVALFKEYLINGDIFEFLTKYYDLRKSSYLLKEIITFYTLNNIIYPNYVILPEGNYIFRNIQQKQRIIDNQEENLKKKKDKEKNKDNKINEDKDKDNILTSKVIDSILNQTDTSEARKDFDINNNSTSEIEEYNKINSLIETIDKAEDLNNKNKIFQKKLIRIVNKDLKGNAFFKMCHYINKNNNNLYLTMKNDNINKKKINQNIFSDNNSPKRANIGGIMSTLSRYEINKILHSNYIDNNNNLSKHKKRNTIEINEINPKNRYLFTDSKEDNSNSKDSNPSLKVNNPYTIKKPIKQSTSYNRKKEVCFKKNSYKKTIYLKKTSNSINKSNNFQFSPFKNYFNIDNNENDKNKNKNKDNESEVKVYKKKFNKINRINTDINFKTNTNRKAINTDAIIRQNVSKQKNEKVYKNLIKSRNNQQYVNTVNMNIINCDDEQNKIQNNNTEILTTNKKYESLSINRANNRKGPKYSNHAFKSIAKMIKRKFIIDDDELNNHNNLYDNDTYQGKNKFIIPDSLTSRNRSIKYDKNQKSTENSNNSKNIYISNNITNNNYYTIENNSKGKAKLLLKKSSEKTEIKKRKINNILKIENKNEQKEKIYLNSEPNTLSSSIVNNIQLNNIKDNKDNSNRVIKTQILSPYKSGLISKTTLKSIDKYSLKYLLNRFNEKSRDKNESKNKIKSNKDNIQLNNNKNKKINIQNDTKTQNKIRLKKRYLILRDNRNGNIVKSIKKANPIKLNEKNNINLRNELFKTTESFNTNKLKLNSLSTKNNNRNNKINFY